MLRALKENEISKLELKFGFRVEASSTILPNWVYCSLSYLCSSINGIEDSEN